MSRRERRAQPTAPTMDLRVDLSSVAACLQCTPQLLLEVDPFVGGLIQEVRHEQGCAEYAAHKRQEARRG